MAEVTWQEMERYFVTRLPEIPVPVLHAEILTAARRFYTDTRAFRDTAPATQSPTVAGQADYSLSAPAFDIVGICEAWLDDNPLTESRNEQSIEEAGGGPPVSGTPTHIRVLLASAAYMLLPTPNVSGGVVKVAFAYRPKIDATGIDDTIFYEHYEAIVELTVATCAKHRGQKWSDPVGAERAMREYDRLALQMGTRAGSAGRRIRTKTHAF